MSYGGSGDEQSEDGELRQSPAEQRTKHDTLDFSLSEEDGDNMDSLDIKPPQAQLANQSSKSKRREGHDRHHKRSDRHRDERHSHRSKHHRERKERDAHYQRDKERYYKEKSNYEQVMYKEYMEVPYSSYREQRSSKEESRRHAERKYDEKKLRYSEAQKHHRARNPDDEKRATATTTAAAASSTSSGDKTLQDLRERLLSKRTNNKSDDDYYINRNEKLYRSSDRKLLSATSSDVDNVLQGEAGLLVKEIISISTNDEQQLQRRHRRDDRFDDDKLTEEERTEKALRREKLLEAEREMVRQKEIRERRHMEKQAKRKYDEETYTHKRSKFDDNIVTVSDNSDEEYIMNEDTRHNNAANDLDDDHMDEMERHNRESEYDDDDHIVEHEDERRNVSDNSATDDDEDEDDEEESSRSHESTTSEHSRTSNASEPNHKSRSRSRSTEMTTATNNSPRSNNNQENAEKVMDGCNESVRKIDDDLPPYYPAIQGCRSVEEFQCLNRIEEGTYGVVYRARDKRTDDIVALKRLKMEKEKEGFPITSLREINTLLKGQHPNIVTVREIVVGSNMDKIFIVMDYVEHDLKSLMETMRHKKQTFTAGEVKCLLKQLLRAVAHLHDNWILHRDLKTSNLLLSHKGILKVGDFGLAREYGSPLKAYTPIVVTLWYRAPELLLCAKEYSTPIDMWSVGCIFAELLLMNALFPGKSEVDQLNRIFKELGTPNERIWPGFNKLPAVMKMKFADYPISNLRGKFGMLSEIGLSLLFKFLTYDPIQRTTAEEALEHQYFNEVPLPIDPAMFPTWPAKSELGHRKALAASPKPPSGGREFKQLGDGEDDGYGFRIGISAADSRRLAMGGGFSLKF